MNKKIVVCNCQGKIIDQDLLNNLSLTLQNSCYNLVQITDLCGACVNEQVSLKKIFNSDENIILFACHKRAVSNLLKFAGIEFNANKLHIVNLRNSVISAIHEILQKNDSECKKIEKITTDNEWPSWYPVIDYSRCTACGQCADFCLFGVYEKQPELVKVVNPKGCKNNCPACARICPQTAIIFPKYQHGGAISGSETIDEIAEQQRLQKDTQEILGSDIYKTLEQRKAKRKSIIKTEAMKKALDERSKFLNS